MQKEEQDQIVELLQARGHTPEEVEKILARLVKIDTETMHDSVMDSISRGSFDLSAIIEEALKEDPK